jgi:16S rRNA (cytosine1402-N4)-methyltransferase
VLADLGYERFHSGLFDLGVSSLQLDEADRGFAYAQDAPLDMRMDQTAGVTAEEVVNSYEPGELVRILRQYGEEKFAPRIVSAIVRERAKGRITSTTRLAELVKEAIPAAARRTGGNPAKRTFQALRIEVNSELAALESAVPAALDALAPKGRLVVMSYQSLEDRIVKRALTARTRSTGPIDLPVELPGTGPTLRLLTRGSEPPTDEEVEANPRAASVKLRAVERIGKDLAPEAGRERPRLSTHGGRGRLRPGESDKGEGRA